MIYLDSAATSLYKPHAVSVAVLDAMKHCASPGRGGHAPGVKAEDILFRCRELASELFHVSTPEHVVITTNATHGLNIAIRSLVRPGSRVVISGYEHNAVTRVLHGIEGVEVRVAAGALFDQESVYCAFCRELNEGADAVILNHVSNVFGFVQPVERVAELCRSRGVPLIVDCAQSAGVLPVDFEGWGAAFAAMPGHKSLLGPQGTGLLLCGEKAEPILLGGTGGSSLVQEMPDHLPDRLEAGTQNVCGAAGLLAAMSYLKERGISGICRREQGLCAEMAERLSSIPDIRLFFGRAHQTGVLSFVADDLDHEELGVELSRRGVAVRAGYHCAPLAHETAGTLKTGTVRASFSPFLTSAQVDAAASVIHRAIRFLRAR